MNCLVGYDDSSSDSDQSFIHEDIKNDNDNSEGGTGVNLLSAEALANQSDDEQDADVDNEKYNKAREYLRARGAAIPGESEKLPNPLVEKLPSPDLVTHRQSTLRQQTSEGNSVFVTSFQKDEQAKLSVLEKHVKVTALPTGNVINGKKVCWLYRKGQCKKGHRCQFAHDNDLFTGESKPDDPNAPSNTQQHVKSFQLGAGYFRSQQAGTSEPPPDDDSYIAGMKRKKRPGINDILQPNKRAMSSLERQRAQERPWTMGSKKNT